MGGAKTELLAAGAQIGKYHLLHRLAVGGMAELHLACAEGLAGFAKIVALKHILPHLAADPDFVELFLNEARLAAGLAHPNIVQVLDIGQAGDDFFYTMEYVHGRNARELLREAVGHGGLPLAVSLNIAISAASALEHTHAATDLSGAPLGLIHRDVSPANLLVSYEGAVKLTDFGIAKASMYTRETVGGAIKGKIGYMPPEQCRGEKVDQRSDLFALGVVLFELTTCQRLFFGDNDFAVLNQVLTGQIDAPSSRVRDYPPALEAIVMRALQPKPDDRFQSAAEFRAALEQFAFDHRIQANTAAVGAWMRESFGEPQMPRVELMESEDTDLLLPTLAVTSVSDPSETVDSEPEDVVEPSPYPRRRRPLFWMGTGATLGLATLLGVGAVMSQGDVTNDASAAVPAPAAEVKTSADAEPEPEPAPEAEPEPKPELEPDPAPTPTVPAPETSSAEGADVLAPATDADPAATESTAAPKKTKKKSRRRGRKKRTRKPAKSDQSTSELFPWGVE